MDSDRTTRRGLLRAAGTVWLAGVAGCGGPSDGGTASPNTARSEADVVAGPDGRLRFEPESITVSPGESVGWYFDSPDHNVSCRPGDSSLVRLPDGAEPFSSYPADASSGSLVDAGRTFEHAFPVVGTYDYVCVPHQRDGMVGRVRVR